MALVKKDTIGDYDPEIFKMHEYYTLVDALNDGIDAMRAGGEQWLEKFPNELAADYKFRLSQTKMTNIFSDIVETLASKPFQKPIALEGDKQNEFLQEFILDVDGAGNHINVFAADVFEAGIRSSIDWIFIDYPTVETDRVTIAEKRTKRLKPYWTRIIAVNVLSIVTDMFGGHEKITYFRYREPGADKTRVRELKLIGNEVHWTLYAKSDDYDDKAETYYVIEKSGIMAIDEIPIVPFITGRRVGRTYQMKPPMKAAADAQRDLYHQESALKYAKVLAAYPMLSASGVKPPTGPDGKVLPIGVGPQKVLYAPPNGDGTVGQWKYIEPNANTLQFLAKDIDASIQNLRELGRQPLTAQSENLTVVTTAYAASKSKSSVGAWAWKLKDTLENALLITLKWEKVTDVDPSLFVFTDFDQFTDDKDLEELGKARERGDISLETYWYELKRRSVLSDSFEPENEKKRLLDEPSVDEGVVTNE